MGILIKNTRTNDPFSTLDIAGFIKEEDAFKFVENNFSTKNSTIPTPSPHISLVNYNQSVEYSGDPWMVFYTPSFGPDLELVAIVKCFHDLKIELLSVGAQLFLVALPLNSESTEEVN